MAYNSKYTGAQVEAILDGAADKVDKVEGKGLSTNDYTDADKAKVAAALTAHQQLKTVNGESLVGSGDITIDGGSGGSAAFEVEEVTYSDSAATRAITDTYYAYITINDTTDRICYNVPSSPVYASATILTVSLNGFSDDGSITDTTVKEWMIVIDCSTGVIPTVTWPSALKWAGGEVMTMEVGYVYEFHIVASTFGAHIVGQKFKAVSA